MTDYPNLESYSEYKKIAEEIFSNPDKIVPVIDIKEIYYIRGDDLLRVDEADNFISLYPGANNQTVLDAIKAIGQ